jgi:hypothetical protein
VDRSANGMWLVSNDEEIREIRRAGARMEATIRRDGVHGGSCLPGRARCCRRTRGDRRRGWFAADNRRTMSRVGAADIADLDRSFLAS